MVRGWSIIFCCGGLLIMSKEYLLSTRGLICKCLGRSGCNCFSTSLRCSVSCMGGRHISIIQAYIICQRCLLSVNRSCPEPFPTNWPLVRGHRECHDKLGLHWGRALGKPAGSYARGKGAVPLTFEPPSRSWDSLARQAHTLLISPLLLHK